MVGALQDAGNTSTLAGYLDLLKESGLLGGLQKFSVDTARRKASIPKLQVFNNALTTIYNPLNLEQTVSDRKAWGRLLESAVGAYIVSFSYIVSAPQN